ncbi:MAG TPA: hypothetical protein VMB05_01845 [Solirubrobacteraceae bacterium]|nr:hypothetical protein [Solirubrobacteraceae bacterium]
MAKVRLLLSLMICSFVICGIDATASQATVPVWLVNGVPLAGFLTGNYNFTASLVFKWKAGTDAFKIKCNNAKSTELLEGRLPGTSKVTAFTFENCTHTAPAGCGMTIPTAVLPWRTLLENDAGVIYQIFTMDAETTVSNCTNGTYNKVWTIKGDVRARTSNTLTGTIQLKFPEEILKGDTLETEGDAVELSGEGELATEGGELQTGEEELIENPAISPAPTTKSPLTFTTSSGESTLQSKAKSSITCKESSGSGEFTGIREGTAKVTFHGCKSSGVGCHGKGEAAETIASSGNVELVDLEKESELTLGLEFAPSELNVECGATSVTIKGTVIGEFSGIEFAKKTKTGTLKLKQEGGKQAIKECHLTKAFCEGKKFLLEANFGKGFEEAGETVEQKFTFGKEAGFYY